MSGKRPRSHPPRCAGDSHESWNAWWERLDEPTKRVVLAKRTTTDYPSGQGSRNKNRISYDICHEHPMLQAFRDRPQPDRVSDFERLLRLVASALPIHSLHHDASANPEAVTPTVLADPDLRPLVSAMWNVLRRRGLSPLEIRERIRSADPFRTQWSDSVEVLNQIEHRENK